MNAACRVVAIAVLVQTLSATSHGHPARPPAVTEKELVGTWEAIDATGDPRLIIVAVSPERTKSYVTITGHHYSTLACKVEEAVVADGMVRIRAKGLGQDHGFEARIEGKGTAGGGDGLIEARMTTHWAGDSFKSTWKLKLVKLREGLVNWFQGAHQDATRTLTEASKN